MSRKQYWGKKREVKRVAAATKKRRARRKLNSLNNINLKPLDVPWEWLGKEREKKECFWNAISRKDRKLTRCVKKEMDLVSQKLCLNLKSNITHFPLQNNLTQV